MANDEKKPKKHRPRGGNKQAKPILVARVVTNNSHFVKL